MNDIKKSQQVRYKELVVAGRV